MYDGSDWRRPTGASQSSSSELAFAGSSTTAPHRPVSGTVFRLRVSAETWLMTVHGHHCSWCAISDQTFPQYISTVDFCYPVYYFTEGLNLLSHELCCYDFFHNNAHVRRTLKTRVWLVKLFFFCFQTRYIHLLISYLLMTSCYINLIIIITRKGGN